MALGANVFLLYAAGAAALGLIAMVMTVRAKNRNKASRQRVRQMSRSAHAS
jgi:hypothetical protein